MVWAARMVAGAMKGWRMNERVLPGGVSLVGVQRRKKKLVRGLEKPFRFVLAAGCLGELAG